MELSKNFQKVLFEDRMEGLPKDVLRYLFDNFLDRPERHALSSTCRGYRVLLGHRCGGNVSHKTLARVGAWLPLLRVCPGVIVRGIGPIIVWLIEEEKREAIWNVCPALCCR